MTENRHGLVVEAELMIAAGTAEREAAQRMLDRIGGNARVTVAGDKAYDTRGFVPSVPSEERDSACGAESQSDRRQRD